MWTTILVTALQVIGKIVGAIFGEDRAKMFKSKAEALEARLATIDESYEAEAEIKDGQRKIEDENRDKTDQQMLDDLNEGQK